MSSIHVYTCSGYSAGMTSHPAGESSAVGRIRTQLKGKNNEWNGR